jgi:hypothetical protein
MKVRPIAAYRKIIYLLILHLNQTICAKWRAFGVSYLFLQKPILISSLAGLTFSYFGKVILGDTAERKICLKDQIRMLHDLIFFFNESNRFGKCQEICCRGQLEKAWQNGKDRIKQQILIKICNTSRAVSSHY